MGRDEEIVKILNIFWHSILTQYRLGFSLFYLAPLAIVLVIIPEFAQHVLEINIGMFANKAAAQALSNDQLRWVFGYAKITGLILAFLATARACWCLIHGGNWYNLRSLSWGKFFQGMILYLLIGFLAEPLSGHVNPRTLIILQYAVALLSIPFLFVMLSGFFNDNIVTVHNSFRYCWPYVSLVVLLILLGFIPMQLLHGFNHAMAIGAAPILVWALMVFDSAVVGLLASLVGAGIAVSYMAFRSRVEAMSI